MHAVETFELIFLLLMAAIALHWAAARLRLPPSVALLVGGGALAFIPGLPTFALDPELVLILFLPPLLMDGAFFTAFGSFKKHLVGILLLAIGAVVFTTAVVGIVVHWLVPNLPWAACFALGAIVSPPDAVAARAVLARVKLPRRVTALLEGESLLNDATGLVLFRFAVAATLTGAFNTGEAIGSFAFLALGGAIVGLMVGLAWMMVLRRLRDETLVICSAMLMCWGAYLAAEAIHVSGVIATVVAGLAFGWYQHVIFTATVRLRSFAFWHTMVFLLEALVFILIGSSLRGVLDRVGMETIVATMTAPIVGVVLAVVLSRFVWVFGCELVTAATRPLLGAETLGWRQSTILSWAGMRGVVTLAVALSLPEAMPGRDLMLMTAFAVIGATVLVQGTSLGFVIGLVKPVDVEPPARMAMPATEAAILRARLVEIEKLAIDADGNVIHPRLLELYRRRAEMIDQYVNDTEASLAVMRDHFEVLLASLAAGRAELIRLHRAGEIEDEVLHDLERDLDVEEMGIRLQIGS